jgi:hypothetical protein
VLTPDTHYIPLRKDFSNVDAVLARLDDVPALERMAERTHADLVASGRYSYRAFAETVLAAVERRLPAKPQAQGSVPAAASSASYLDRLLAASDSLGETPTREPRTNLLYRVAVAMRLHEATAVDAGKLARWAARECAGREAELAALQAAQDRIGEIDAGFKTALHRGHDAADASAIDRAVADARSAYASLEAEIAGIALGSRSWTSARMAALRAPWVEQDVPQLRWAKTLRERAYASPAIRRLYAAVKARRSG